MSYTCDAKEPDQINDLSVLISSAFGGDPLAIRRLRDLLIPGVRARLVHRNANPSLSAVILTEILDQVRVGRISSQADLLRQTRLAVIAMAERGQGKTAPQSVRDTGLCVDLSPLDREMMRRYYVDGEPAESICRRMSIEPAVFIATKKKLRAASLAKSVGPAATD